MALFNRIAIIGVGLIGGSVGLAAKRKCLAKEVIGIGRRRSSLDRALKKGAIDRAMLDPGLGVACADLVILATPISVMPGIASEIRGSLRPGSIVVDVGSTKKELVREIEKTLPKTVHYIGCHPMAGSEKRGVDFASAGLFENSVCIITPSAHSEREVKQRVKRFWMGLGARVVYLTPQMHDNLIAQVSHLPHIAATALVVSAADEAMKLASGGFKDTTRIASSEPVIWRDICMSNKKSIVGSLDKYISALKRIRAKIRAGEARQLEKFFEQAKAKRDKLTN